MAEDLAFTEQSVMESIARSVRKAKVPAIFPWHDYSRFGALLTYGINRQELPRQLALYVDKILKGAKPADLPVE